jgi:ribosome-associated protein
MGRAAGDGRARQGAGSEAVFSSKVKPGRPRRVASGHDPWRQWAMIEVTPSISLRDEEVQWKAVRASGPGGQHVNKTSTAVELRFDVRGSPSLPEPVRARLYRLAGARLTQDGVLVLTAQAHRSQELNRQAAVERLLALIRKAAEPPPPPRKKTRPTLASRQRRLEGKARRGGVKSLRGKPSLD